MKPRPSSSTTSFMLIATDSVTSWACAGLTAASSRKATRAPRITTDICALQTKTELAFGCIVPGPLAAYQSARLGITTASQALHTDMGQCMTHAVPDDLRVRPIRPGPRRGHRSAGDCGPAAVSDRPGGARERDDLRPTGPDV